MDWGKIGENAISTGISGAIGTGLGLLGSIGAGKRQKKAIEAQKNAQKELNEQAASLNYEYGGNGSGGGAGAMSGAPKADTGGVVAGTFNLPALSLIALLLFETNLSILYDFYYCYIYPFKGIFKIYSIDIRAINPFCSKSVKFCKG